MAKTRYHKGKAAQEAARVRNQVQSWSNEKLVQAMATVVMLPGSFDKRFMRNVATKVQEGKALTDKQRNHLEVCVAKYRRQIDFKKFTN